MYVTTYVVPKIVKLIEIENIMVIVRGWGKEEMRSYYLICMDLHFYKMIKVLGIDVDDGCTTI